MTTVGFGFSAYLTYREAASIHAYCEWCLSSAGIMTVLFLCAIGRYVTGTPRHPGETFPVLDEEPSANGRVQGEVAEPRV
jgi:uncharacterized membrane protein